MLAHPKAPTASDSTGSGALEAVQPNSRRQTRSPMPMGMRRSLLGLLFIAPALITLAATFVFPLAYNLWLSLLSYNLAELYLGIRFAGLRNYTEILQDSYFWNAFRNSGLLTAACLALELPIGMALALILQERIKGHSVFRFIFILPLPQVPSLTAYIFPLRLHPS